MATRFNGVLNSNEIFAALYNMIINIMTFADPIQEGYSDLVNSARVDGSMYGDSKLYVSTRELHSVPWGGDSEASNLLKLHRPPSPVTERITLNVFRMVAVTVDEYLSKRAWGTAGAFDEFNSVVLSWVSTTKRVYDETLYNVFVGTATSGAVGSGNVTQAIFNNQNRTVEITDRSSLTSPTEIEAANRIDGLLISKALADLVVDIADMRYDFNDNGFLRSYSTKKLRIVWNAEFYNRIKKIDEPTIFHKDGLLADLKESVLPARYFGAITSAAVSAANNDGTMRAVYEEDFATAASQAVTHVFPGDLIPASTARVTALNDDGTAKTVDANGVTAGHAYVPDSTIAFKVIADGDIPYMSGFQVGTSFFNSRSLTTTNYLIWAHNTLTHLSEYPLVTFKAVPADPPEESEET